MNCLKYKYKCLIVASSAEEPPFVSAPDAPVPCTRSIDHTYEEIANEMLGEMCFPTLRHANMKSY